MAFDYNLASADSSILLVSRIRFGVGDSVEGAGPRPDGRNFSNEELLLLYAAEDNHQRRAEAAAFEVLAAEWSAYNGRHKLGPEDEQFDQAGAFVERAEKLRKLFGYGSSEDMPNRGGFSIAMRPTGQDG